MDRPDPHAVPRAALLEDRARLLDELGDISIQAPEMMTYGSQAAAASQVFTQQRDLALRDHTRSALQTIDAALARLEAGTYGRCTACGARIAPERLEALPSAALCIACQRLGGRR